LFPIKIRARKHREERRRVRGGGRGGRKERDKRRAREWCGGSRGSGGRRG
jgi:hypothetical protein